MSPKERQMSDETNIAVMASNVADIKNTVSKIENRLDYNYVTKEAFDPVKKLVYGLVGLILISVVVALLALVLKK
jgi:ABC-type phosphate transport system permease subunit